MLWVLIKIVLVEAIVTSTHNIGFYEKEAKLSLNYYQILSNMHIIFSSDHGLRESGFFLNFGRYFYGGLRKKIDVAPPLLPELLLQPKNAEVWT